jgi:hypothetical protein
LLDTTLPFGTITINQDATYTTKQEVTLNLVYDDNLSGVLEVQYSNYPNFEGALWESPSVIKSWKLLEGDGTKTVYYRLKDKARNISNIYSDKIYLKLEIATVTLTINNEATYTTQESVTLNISYQKPADIKDIYLTNDPSTGWGSPLGTPTTYPWELHEPLVDGLKTVYLKAVDAAWNEFITYDTIILDKTSPAGGVTINQDAEFTNTITTTLSLVFNDKTSGVYRVKYKNDGESWTQEEVATITKTWQLKEEEGQRIVYYLVKDNAGNEAIYQDSIIFDRTKPWGTITINQDAVYTTNRNVTLDLSAKDNLSGVAFVRFCNEGEDITKKDFEPVSTTKAWLLTINDGTKTVYYQIKDKANNLSDIYQDSIILDTTLPSGTITINSDATYTTKVNVTLSLEYYDALSGVDKVCYSNDGINYTQWLAPQPTYSWNLTQADGVKTVYYKIKDKANNYSFTYTDTICLDKTPPAGTITINNKATFTTSIIQY